MNHSGKIETTRSGRVTIRTVAEHAGVSVAAVSKVLRNAYGVSAALRAKVEASIAVLNYRPNTAARAMRGQTFTIGVVLPDIQNPFFSEIIDGIDDGLEGLQYIPLFGIGRGSTTIETTIINALIDRQVDGLIMIGQRLPFGQIDTVARQVPVVVVGHHEPRATSFDSANNDDELGGELTARHLLERGYLRPAMVSLGVHDLMGGDVSQRREIGFRRVLEAAGYADRDIRIAQVASTLNDVTLTVRTLLESGAPPDAIFGWADYYALEVLSAVRTLGLRVPDDVGVIGYDNSAPCAFTQNDLTSIDQSGRTIGRNAVRLLLERIGGRAKAEHFVVTPVMRMRGSTSRSQIEG